MNWRMALVNVEELRHNFIPYHRINPTKYTRLFNKKYCFYSYRNHQLMSSFVTIQVPVATKTGLAAQLRQIKCDIMSFVIPNSSCWIVRSALSNVGARFNWITKFICQINTCEASREKNAKYGNKKRITVMLFSGGERRTLARSFVLLSAPS